MGFIAKQFLRSSLLIFVIVTFTHFAECSKLIELITELSERCSYIETIPRQIPGDLAIHDDLALQESLLELDTVTVTEEQLNDINDNIQLFLEDGFAEAENILNEENNVASQKTTTPSMLVYHKEAGLDEKIPSACRGLGLLETSKAVIFALNFDEQLTTEETQHVLQSVILPEEIPTGLQEICDQLDIGEIECDPDYPYRLCDGVCNNLENPLWGSAGNPHKRYLLPKYIDGLAEPPSELQGLPNPRQLSNALNMSPIPHPCKEDAFQCVIITQMLKAFGQFLDHDMTRTPEAIASIHPENGSGPELECCNEGQFTSPKFEDCLPIEIIDDPIFPICKKCLRFVRSLPADVNALGYREQINSITSFIDASNVYGSTSTCQANEDPLRLFEYGLMLVNEEKPPGEGCTLNKHCELPFLPETNNVEDLFVAGDIRVNDQPSLTSLHTLFIRYHNKIATKYMEIYPLDDDEEIYQQTRRIVVAVFQNIVYNEFLPIVLSPAVHAQYDLAPQVEGYSDGYDTTINPTTANVFATAAYRFGHTLIGEFIKGDEIIPLEQTFFRNEIIKTEPMYPSKILDNECTLAAKAFDVLLVDAIRNNLFAKESDGFLHGTDLFSLNIMRGRDHGIPGYNQWREFCGLEPFGTFEDWHSANIMDEDIVDVLEEQYNGIIDNVEIFPAGIAEYPLHEGVVGPTFACLLGNQFRELKNGDRFYYENEFQPLPFTEDQLDVIRKTTLASVLCEATSITKIQPFPFLKETIGNFEEECSEIVEETVLPELEFYW